MALLGSPKVPFFRKEHFRTIPEMPLPGKEQFWSVRKCPFRVKSISRSLEIWPKVVDGWGGKVCILRVSKKKTLARPEHQAGRKTECTHEREHHY